MNNLVDEIRQAYTEETRQLDFLASRPISTADSVLAEAINAIGDYNNFEPDVVLIRLRRFPGQVLIGREGSPVLYVRLDSQTGLDVENFRDAMLACDADEFNQVGEFNSGPRGLGGWFRVWWD